MKKLLTISLVAMSAAACVFAQEAPVGEVVAESSSIENALQEKYPDAVTKNGNYFFTGSAPIAVPAGKKGHALSRTIAYTEAFAKARIAFQQFLEVEISSAMKSLAEEGGDSKIDPVIAGLVKESMAKKAQAAGIDPNDPAAFSKFMKDKVVGSASFKSEVSAVGAGFQQGLMTFASLSSTTEVGVIAHFSQRNLNVARALWSNQVTDLKEGKAGSVLKEQMPKTPGEWASTFGVRVRRNEKGEYCVVGFGHGVAASNSRRSISNASSKARLLAMEEIKSFAGSEIAFSELEERAQSSAEVGGQEFALNSETFKQSIEQKKTSLKISGLTQVASQVVKLPSGEIVVIAAFAWVPSATIKADAVHNQMEQGRANKNAGFKPAPASSSATASERATSSSSSGASTQPELKAVGTAGGSASEDLD